MKLATLPLLFYALATPLHAQTDAAQYLKQHATTPEQYVLSKFDDNDIVVLGEPHWVKQHVVLVQHLIPLLNKRGVHVLAIEFARHVDQPLIDSLLALPYYNESLARRIFFQQYVHWAFQEYVDLLKAAWQVNRQLAPGEKPFRILGVNGSADWSLMKTAADQTDQMRRTILKGQGEDQWAKVVIDSVLARHEKALTYSGTHHAFTHYLQPVVSQGKFYRKDPERFAHYIWLAAPGRVFMIALYAPWPGSRGYDDERVRPAGGAIDRLVTQLGAKRRHIGFDLKNTPLGQLVDSASVYSRGYEPFNLAKYADGMIYIPISEFEPVTIIPDFVNDCNLEYARAHSPDIEFRNAALSDFYQVNLHDVAIIRSWAKQFAAVVPRKGNNGSRTMPRMVRDEVTSGCVGQHTADAHPCRSSE